MASDSLRVSFRLLAFPPLTAPGDLKINLQFGRGV
jgi:hypothetical protein